MCDCFGFCAFSHAVTQIAHILRLNKRFCGVVELQDIRRSWCMRLLVLLWHNPFICVFYRKSYDG